MAGFTQKTHVKSNPQSGDFLCIPSPNYWYIYIFIHRCKRKSIDFYEFSTCALVVWKTFLTTVFFFFLFVDVWIIVIKNFFFGFCGKLLKNAKLVLVIHFLMKEEALYGIPRCFME